MTRILAVLLILASGLCSAEPLRIAVAANFKPTLTQLHAQFAAVDSTPLSVSSASTGVLATQVQYGAPFDLFLAADKNTPLRLAQQYNTAAFCYARGRLALLGGPLAALADVTKSLAIANPVTAPYGAAAQQVLERAQFQPAITRKLIRGANVAQAYQFWHSRSVDLALVPLAMAPADAALVPASWHTPIDQYALILKPSATLDRYLNWFRSDNVRALIREAGYEPCH